MARGGYRPGAGRPKGTKRSIGEPELVAPDIARAARKYKLSPLDYMLSVVNNAEADQGRRDRMAVAAAPFCHPRKAESRLGPRAEKADAAKEAASGKFAPPAPPKLIVNNG